MIIQQYLSLDVISLISIQYNIFNEYNHYSAQVVGPEAHS